MPVTGILCFRRRQWSESRDGLAVGLKTIAAVAAGGVLWLDHRAFPGIRGRAASGDAGVDPAAAPRMCFRIRASGGSGSSRRSVSLSWLESILRRCVEFLWREL